MNAAEAEILPESHRVVASRAAGGYRRSHPQPRALRHNAAIRHPAPAPAAGAHAAGTTMTAEETIR